MTTLNTIVTFILKFLSSIEPGYALAILAIGMVVTHLYLLNRNPVSRIYFEDLFINHKTGKMGGSEFRLNTAFLATTWALIFMVIKGNLTEWFFAAYLAAFVFDKFNSRQKESGNDNKEGKPGAGTPEV